MKEKMDIRVHVVKYIDRIEKKKKEREDCLLNIIVFRVASYFIGMKNFATDR